MLAGLQQGPGFPNLSCLGLLSDRILHPYCRPPWVAHSTRMLFRAWNGLEARGGSENGHQQPEPARRS
jgi:hypothetical protein